MDTTFPFRPRKENLEDWNLLREALKKKGITLSAFFNAILFPAHVEIEFQQPNSEGFYNLNLGQIRLK